MSKKKNIIELSVPELRERVKAGIKMREVRDKDIDYSDIPELTDELLRSRLKRLPKRKKAFG